MKKVFLIGGILILVVLGIVGAFYLKSGNKTQIQENVDSPNNIQTNLAASQVSLHSTQSDCWVVYDGSVYDVTSFLNKHPGGANAITPFCGKTGDEFKIAFEGQHGESKVGILQSQGKLKGILAGD